MDILKLGELQLDALREVANIGAGHAATALSEMTGRTIMVEVPEVRIVRLEDVGALLGDPAEVVSAVIVRLTGGLTGRTLQIFPGPTASRLTAMVLGGGEPHFPDGFGALQRSALTELGNIMVGAYLAALGQFVAMELHMSVPAIAIDMAGAVLTTSYINFGTVEDNVICVDARLGVDARGDLPSHFLLIPDGDSLAAILRALGIG